MLRGMPQIVKVLADVKGSNTDPDYASKLERAESEAKLAITEAEKDFPVLHGFAVVALWSWLEHFVKDFLTLWIINKRGAMNTPVIHRLRVRLGDYLPLTKAEQAQMVVELLEGELASPLKQGATRFDSLLEPFGLTSALSSECRKTLFELQQVRNAIAHRNGRADRRLRSACPWLKLKHNQPVLVSRKMLHSYSEASAEYLLFLLYNVSDMYGLDVRPKKEANKPAHPTAGNVSV